MTSQSRTSRYAFEDVPGFIEEVMRSIEGPHGVHVTAVMPTADEPGPTMVYSTGLSEHGQPEVFLSGLAHPVAHSVVNEVARRVREEGLTLAPGTRVVGMLGADREFDLVACAVTDHEVNVSRVVYGHNVEVVQLVFPDLQGHLPWEPGYAASPLVQGTAWVRP